MPEFPLKLEPGKYYLFQIKGSDPHRELRDESYDFYERHSRRCELENYDLVYTGPLGRARTAEECAGQVYDWFCNDLPKDYNGRNAEVGDIIVITPGGEAHAFFVDSYGYQKVDYFLQEVAGNLDLPKSEIPAKLVVTEEDRIRARDYDDSPIGMEVYVEGAPVEEGHAVWIGLPTTPALFAESVGSLPEINAARNNWRCITIDNNPEMVDFAILDDSLSLITAENIDEINYLAALLEKLSPEDVQKFSAIAEAEYLDFQGVKNMINILQNLEIFEFLPDITTREEYARYLVKDTPTDYRVHLSDMEKSYTSLSKVLASGTFTSKGFLRTPLKRYEKYYDGKNVPEQYRLGIPTEPVTKEQRKPPKRDDRDR